MLVGAQLAAAVVLAVGAGLFARSLGAATRRSPGFDVDRLATVSLRGDILRYTEARGRQFYRESVERVEALPGVTAATLARTVPLSGGTGRAFVYFDAGPAGGPASTGAADPPTVAMNVVGPPYFEALGVASRTRELGIRAALGATHVDLIRLVVRDGLRLAVVGVALGGLGAWLLARLATGFPYGVSPADPLTFLAVAGLLVVVMLGASFAPARRAAGSDPIQALRID